MRAVLVLLVTVATAAACSKGQRYPLTGQVLAVDLQRQELTVRHDDIRGFMPGMTMPFRVKDAAEASARKPGDLITATLVVESSTGYLENVRKTGEAPLPADMPPPAAPTLRPGDEVPAAAFTDQDGRRRQLADWRGRTLVVTFVYTRCPLPEFCPLMDRHFAAVQKALQADPGLAGRVHLLSVSFDPAYDTPAVLKAHARRVGADPDRWSYVTATRAGIDAFAAAFGVTLMREDGTITEIVHNLRTAVIDADGRLAAVLNGNSWQPDALLEAIRAADARR